MPSYTFVDKDTNKRLVLSMSMKELDRFLEENKHLELVVTAPAIVSGRGMQKPDSNFRDLLKDMKKKHSGGFTKSTINDW